MNHTKQLDVDVTLETLNLYTYIFLINTLIYCFCQIPTMLQKMLMISSAIEYRSDFVKHMSEVTDSQTGRFNPNRCSLKGNKRQIVS